ACREYRGSSERRPRTGIRGPRRRKRSQTKTPASQFPRRRKHQRVSRWISIVGEAAPRKKGLAPWLPMTQTTFQDFFLFAMATPIGPIRFDIPAALIFR